MIPALGSSSLPANNLTAFLSRNEPVLQVWAPYRVLMEHDQYVFEAASGMYVARGDSEQADCPAAEYDPAGHA